MGNGLLITNDILIINNHKEARDMMKNNFNGILLIIIISSVFVIAGSVGVSAISATGGTITYDGDYTVHTFTNSGTFAVSTGGEVEILVVAGGGGGGGSGGGGGAGGLIYKTKSLTPGNNIVTVGAGGAGGSASAGSNGLNSVFDNEIAIGGGRGGGPGGSSAAGGSGGSGGGGVYHTGAGGSETAEQGNNGGAATSSPTYRGGGGGGAGAVGASGVASGNGGVGLSVFGTYYAGGGGGGCHVSCTSGSGGSGGGGAGGVSYGNGIAGTVNTGGGGGGAGSSGSANFFGGTGGSGIVIIRYIEEPVLEISNPQPTNNSQLAFGTTNTTLGVSTNINANCKYSTSLELDFSQMIFFSTTGGTSHSSTIIGLTNGGNYDYYIKCNDTATSNVTYDYYIHFNVSDTGTYDIDFDTESAWVQEDATDGTVFVDNIIRLFTEEYSFRYFKITIINSSSSPSHEQGQVAELQFYNSGTESWIMNDMTSSTTPSPKVVTGYAPNGFYGTTPVWKMFDGFGPTSSYVDGVINYAPFPYYVTIDFGNGNNYIISQYRLSTSSYCDAGGCYKPTVWTLEGSNDDSTWNLLDSRSGISFTGGETKTFLTSISSAYPTSKPYYIYSNNSQIDTSSWPAIKSVTTTETTPSGTSLKYLVSFDGRINWKYWAGSAWTTSTLDDLQTNGMSKTALEAITESQWSYGFSAGTLDFAIDLGTTNSANTPELSGITIQYTGGAAGCVDNDGDGYGTEGTNLTQCDNPTVPDCNDNNADINPEAYDIVGNGIDEDCSGSDASYNFSIETDFLYPSGTSTYYVGDDIWYQITIRRDGVLYNPSEIKLNLTNHYGHPYGSHTKSGMTYVSVGVYNGYFGSTNFDNSVADDVRYDVWIYGDMNELLDYNIHRDFDLLDGTAPSISSSTYTVTTNAISNYTVKDLVVNGTQSKIDWTGTSLDLNAKSIDFDTATIFSDKFVKVDSVAYSELNNSATLTFDNVDCSSPYVFYSATANDRATLLSENNQCLAPQCTNIQCIGTTLTVDVLSFSGYAAEADVNLSIDADDPKLVGQEVHFTADYRNVTDDSPIPGATCTIYFTDGNYPMAEGAIYTYNRTFVTEGLKDYNVTCSKTGFSTLTAFDNATITSAEIPEFSIITLGLGLVAVLIGLVIVRKKQRI